MTYTANSSGCMATQFGGDNTNSTYIYGGMATARTDVRFYVLQGFVGGDATVWLKVRS